VVSFRVWKSRLAALLLGAIALVASASSPTAARAGEPDSAAGLFVPPALQNGFENFSIGPAPSSGGEACGPFWVISTRQLPGFCDCRASDGRFDVGFYPTCGSPVPATIDDFLATDDPRTLTVIFIHGNGVDCDLAISEGRKLYAQLLACGSPSIRFVIYSWPSEYQGGRLRSDLDAKFRRTDAEMLYFAYLVDLISPDAPITSIGYSYGARVVTGGLHLLGGGAINCQTLSVRKYPARQPLRVILLAAAVEYDVLGVGGLHGNALSEVSRMSILINPDDRVLNLFPKLSEGRRLPALGDRGPLPSTIAEADRAKLEIVDVSDDIGRHHSFASHVKSAGEMNIVRAEVGDAAASAEPVAPAPAPGTAARQSVMVGR
jgi:esterase/lipase superfamily enzyme